MLAYPSRLSAHFSSLPLRLFRYAMAESVTLHYSGIWEIIHEEGHQEDHAHEEKKHTQHYHKKGGIRTRRKFPRNIASCKPYRD